MEQKWLVWTSGLRGPKAHITTSTFNSPGVPFLGSEVKGKQLKLYKLTEDEYTLPISELIERYPAPEQGAN